MSPDELYARYPTFRFIIGEYADWDYDYSSPYQVIQAAISGLGKSASDLDEELRAIISDIPNNPALREAISRELNVWFTDDKSAIDLLGEMLFQLNTKKQF